jgi:hypothetical protein
LPPVSLRPRSTTELIDASVQLLRQHYLELVTVSALFMIPVIVGSVLLEPVQPTPGEFYTGQSLAALASLLVLQIVFYSASTAATVVIVSDSYLGREVTIGAAVERVFERIWTVLGVVLLQGLIIGLGFTIGIIALFIPGFLFTAWFFASTNVVMVEGKSATEALSRSRDLALGSVGRILGTLFLAGLIVGLAQILVAALLVATVASFRTGTVAAGVLPYVVRIFLYPLVNVVITLLYYDLRIRKEGFDLELMAKELGFGAAAPAGAPAA